MRKTILAAFAAAAALPLGFARPAQAQTIYGFGDSLIDTRRVCALLTGTYPGAATYGTCSNGEGTLEFLPSYSRYSFSRANDYASGGAGTGSYSVAAPLGPEGVGVDTEIDQFTAAGGRIAPDDLVVMSGTSNNVFQLAADPSLSGAALAQTAFADIRRGVSALIGVGARNLVYYGGSPADGGLSEGTGAEAAAYSTAINQGLAATLAPFAAPGVRVRILDFEAVYIKAFVDPAYYGFKANGECVADPACVSAPLAVQDQRFQYDIHPTQAGEELLARYIGALVQSDDALAPQADVAAAASQGFGDSLLRRLDSQRAAGLAESGPLRRVSVFVQGGHAQTHQDDWFGLGGAADGFTDDQDAVLVGAGYRLDPHLSLGAAAGYTRSDARLSGEGGRIGADSGHLAGFASLTWPDRFADVVVGYGHHELSVDRPGVVDRLAADPRGDSVTVAGQGGWLFPLGPVRAGPLANLRYARTRLTAYTETGDPVLTQHVEPQTEETLDVGVGAQVRTDFRLFGRPFSSFLDLTAQQTVLGGDRTLLSENTFARDLPIYTVIDANRRTPTFGLLAAGVETPVGFGLNLTVSGEATAFARETGYAVTGALTRAF